MSVGSSQHIYTNLDIIVASLGGTLRGRTGSDFPWKTLPKELARLGYVLVNYPDETLMPGELRPTISRSKGIHDLTQQHRVNLINCLKAGTLTIRAVTNDAARMRLTTSKDPVIIGDAPSACSMYPRGRRAFADGHIDQKGLRRLQRLPSPVLQPSPSPILQPSPSPVLQLSSSPVSHCRVQVIVEITQPPPRPVSITQPRITQPPPSSASITRPPPCPASRAVHKPSSTRTEHLIPPITSVNGAESSSEHDSTDDENDCEDEICESGRYPVKRLRR